MRKTWISLLLAIALVVSLGVPALAADTQYKTITGTYHYCPSLGFLDIVGNSSLTFTYSDEYFTHTGYQYDHALANISMVMMQTAFANANAAANEFKNATANFEEFVKLCGFTRFAANEDANRMTEPNSLGAMAASKTVFDNGGNYTLICLGLRGHNYGHEWGGNFLMGVEGDHTGFAIARDKALDFLRSYIAEQHITGRIKLWTSGFSRAAATANLLCAKLDDGAALGDGVKLSKHDIYCYTFETPQGTANTAHCRDQVYNNIHNIMNPNDIVPLVGFDEYGFDRYGVDYYVPCRQYDENYQPMADVMYQELTKMGWSRFYLIDDFHYIDVNPLTWFSTETNEITQIEYYDMLFRIILDEWAPTRQVYVNELQNDIVELTATLLGFDTGSLLKAVQSFAGKLTSQLPQIMTSGKAADMLVDLFMESLQEVGAAGYNGDQVRAMLANLAPRVVVLLANHPSETITLVANLMQILNAHFSEVTHAWLRTLPASYMEQQAKPIVYQGEYSDVKTTDWFSDEVEYAALGNLMQGMGGGLFSPDRNTTRAEFAAVLYRLEGSPETTMSEPFADVADGSWYQQSVAWAYQNGVVKGMTSDTFEPDGNITREQMVTMLHRFASRVQKTSTAASLTRFTDSGAVSDWAGSAMQWAVGRDIISGMGDGTLAPQGLTTRAQIARVLQQFCETN